MPNLVGIHDHEGLVITPPDTWVLNLAALSENQTPPNFASNVHWITRLNWGYGSTGTLPVPDQYSLYAARAAHYVRQSQGCHRWIIGNEPNLPREWPNGQPIFPNLYAACYRMTRAAIRAIPGHEQDEVLVAASGPWNADLKYPGNPTGDWIENFTDVLELLGQDMDGFSIHAYTHGYNVHLVTSSARMDAPFQSRHYEFRTYRDYMEAIPRHLEHLPVYLTEANGNGPWQAVGLMPAMAQEIHNWNQDTRHPISALIFYRYPKYDDFNIQGKSDVIAEYISTVNRNYPSPRPAKASGSKVNTVHIPDVRKEEPAMTQDLPTRNITDGFKARVPYFKAAQPRAGNKFFTLIRAEYLPPPEGARRFGPDRHILVDVLDAQGRRRMDTPVNFVYSGKMDVATVRKEREPYGVDFPMQATGHSYGCWVGNFEQLSDRVDGMGLGTIEQMDWAHHVTYFLVFQEATAKEDLGLPPAPVQPPPSPPAQPPPKEKPVINIRHPLDNPERFRITQRFGENKESYARFNIAGHTGIDIACPTGTPVYAVASGRVMESRNDPEGYGEYIKIDHGNFESLYAHLSARRYNANSQVRQGDQIGLSGNSGNSTGAHLHFAMRIKPYVRGWPHDGYSDPEPYLNKPSVPVQDTSLPNKEIIAIIKRAAQEFGVDWKLMLSLALAESSLDPDIDSLAGAQGLMQVSPGTWDDWAGELGAGDNPYDAYQNARVGTRYMKFLLERTNGNVYKALQAYVWGIGNVERNYDKVTAEVIAYSAKIVHGRDLLGVLGL